ncbi:M1 family metallopeptidase [Flammeovirga sp. EKP202]|uniref:M1 family metallopeptidase n=1 Tax=Flammeovirga sp. EKP202 TaxID=2770592 RepID=UPI00165F5DC0|nr:M1 family metallopeptidase [Flammeovirga sp. EKP202]MBD0402235.1 M1 family metallopeptidase [Flammeovirga sp. EKP202]
MTRITKLFISFVVLVSSTGLVFGQKEFYNNNKFKQLDEELPTPNVYRTGSGAPGHEYWQQKADYVIEASIDEKLHRLTGAETVTYYNNSPDVLTYLWIQLDQNMRATDSDTYKIRQNKVGKSVNINQLAGIDGFPEYDGGHKIQKVTDASGNPIKYTINKTMMRLDLPQALNPGEKVTFNIDWYYNINDRLLMGGRGGYETFAEDGNTIYTITQWFPRMAVYDDFNGWQHKQFLGNGEFALTFGDYDVKITVPSDHIVASTGELQNPDEILTEEQKKRFEESKTADKPVVIVSQKEAEKKEKTVESGTKTWHYKAKNVRDFAFGSSRKFIWDAMGVDINGKTVMAMSYYPKEANPLYGQYSTEAVAHTLEVYSKYTIDYPYPVAISVEASNGMEYPMICFNYGRPEKDGTYSPRIKYGMISVIIHEVGHNFFPMIINSDERQWTWMDEGLNTFCQYLAEQEWEVGYPSRRGPAENIVNYMKGEKNNITPIMTNSESIKQFGNNAYGKPATALNILRETIMGRELFDYAFKEYAERWAFKHPKPADFYRTMEDASGVDLDWFWRGWFFTTEAVDISIEDVTFVELDTQDPKVEEAKRKAKRDAQPKDITTIHNEEINLSRRVDRKPELKDFYNSYDELDANYEDHEKYKKYQSSLNKNDKAWIASNKHLYEVKFKNVGGLVMPIIVELQYEDGTSEKKYIPAEIWKKDDIVVSKVFVCDKPVVQFVLDPNRETADIDTENNYFPRQNQMSRFQLYKSGANQPRSYDSGRLNPMQKAKKKK